MDIYGLARSIVLRVLTLLTLLNVIYPSTFVFDFGTLVGSLLRSIHWAAIYLLVCAPLFLWLGQVELTLDGLASGGTTEYSSEYIHIRHSDQCCTYIPLAISGDSRCGIGSTGLIPDRNSTTW